MECKDELMKNPGSAPSAGSNFPYWSIGVSHMAIWSIIHYTLLSDYKFVRPLVKTNKTDAAKTSD